MDYLTLTEIQEQLRLSPDDESESFLTLIGKAAEDYVVTFLNAVVVNTDAELDPESVLHQISLESNPNVKMCMLQYCGSIYANSESESPVNITTIGFVDRYLKTMRQRVL